MDKRLKVNFCPHGNFGDTSVPYFLKKLKVPFIFTHEHVPNKVCMTGSILHAAAKKNTYIWGSGLMYAYHQPSIEAKYIALRGFKSYDRAKEVGCDVSTVEALGDPALLLPRVFNPEVPKMYKLGIIPHIMDYDICRNYVQANKDRFESTIVINSNTKPEDMETYITQVLSCEKIVASSLHGLVCAQAYGIGSKWITISDQILGDGIKYLDYYSTLDLGTDEIILPVGMPYSQDIRVPGPFKFKIDLDALWECRPWERVGDEFYVDIDNPEWTKECYPENYTGKIVDDFWWRKLD